jgi:hypothetical protein
MHPNEAFCAPDDLLEAAVFSQLMVMVKEMDKIDRERSLSTTVF